MNKSLQIKKKYKKSNDQLTKELYIFLFVTETNYCKTDELELFLRLCPTKYESFVTCLGLDSMSVIKYLDSGKYELHFSII